MINESTIAEFRRVSKIHEDWLVYAVVGSDLLTKGELEAVVLYGLPIDYSLDLTTVSYTLGKKAAHLKDDAYKSLSYSDLSMPLSDLEQASVMDLRLRASSEIRQVAQYVSKSLQARMQAVVTNSLQKSVGVDLSQAVDEQMDLLAKETFAKAFILFGNLYNMAMLDLINVSKSTALVNSMVQQEGIYTEGLDSQVMVEQGGKLTPLTAEDLLTKSLSGMDLHYVPPGGEFVDGKIRVVDRERFIEAISKATAGVSGGISSTVAPTGPPQPKSVASPGSVKGLAAPGNDAGPGRGNEPNAPKKGVEYDQYQPAGAAQPEGPGWEQSTTGGWRHIKGAGGAGPQAPQDEHEKAMQKDMDAQFWGRQPKKPIEVVNHLAHGEIATLKPLGDEGGVNVAFRVSIDGNGRGIMKPKVDMWDPEVDDELVGSGFGSIEQGTEHQREAAAHKMSALLGSDLVPPTTTRSYGGETHSIQALAEGHESTAAWLESRTAAGEWDTNNFTELLLSKISPEHQDSFIEKLNHMTVQDIIMNNNDRHHDNIVINEDGSDFKAIDHGLAFGIGVKGIRSDFLHDLGKMGKAVTIPSTLQTRLENTSLGDYKRALSDNLSDWEVGQTYLRGKYVLHLQSTEGHLDPAKFSATMDQLGGGNEMPLQHPNDDGDGWDLDSSWMVGNSNKAGWDEFTRRKEEKQLPNDLFNSWAKDYINTHKGNPESSDHDTAKQLDEIGVFMTAEGMKDPKAFRKEGGHREAEKSITAGHPPTQVSPKKPLATGPVNPYGKTQQERRGVDSGPRSAKTVKERRRKDG